MLDSRAFRSILPKQMRQKRAHDCGDIISQEVVSEGVEKEVLLGRANAYPSGVSRSPLRGSTGGIRHGRSIPERGGVERARPGAGEPGGIRAGRGEADAGGGARGGSGRLSGTRSGGAWQAVPGVP